MLTLWKPFAIRASSAVTPWQPDFRNLFREFSDFGFNAAAGLPPTDVIETENAIQLKMDLPGLSLEDIEVKVEKVAGKPLRNERFYGSYTRSFVLPETIDGSKPEAQYAHGVLTVTLPKREEAKPKLIKVEVKQ